MNYADSLIVSYLLLALVASIAAAVCGGGHFIQARESGTRAWPWAVACAVGALFAPLLLVTFVYWAR